MINKHDKYFFFENGMKKGPISASSLANVVRYGSLTGESIVLRLGENETQKVADTCFAHLLGTPRPVTMAKRTSIATELRSAIRRPRQWLLRLLTKKYLEYQLDVWKKYYGNFDEGDYSSSSVRIEGSEVGNLPGEFIVWLGEVLPADASILFAGDSRDSARQMAKAIGVKTYTTTGILDVDHQWDFNDKMPDTLPYVDAIVSLSMLEHILAPYAHVNNLVSRLRDGGFLMIYTCAPGFDYHRYPIDTLRFHIDWFEEAALKLGLTVVRKRLAGYGIFILFKLERNPAQ